MVPMSAATTLPDHLVSPRAIADRLVAADEAYVRAHFVPLAELAGDRLAEVRDAIATGRLPAPAYVLDDGTEMVAPDHLALFDESGGDLEAAFRARYAAAGGEDADEDWAAYLSGGYAVCLRSVTPENIVRKGRLVDHIQAALGDPHPRDAGWRESLRAAIDELDALERPFAPLDEYRFGNRPTRKRFIEDPRARWPWLGA
jgi:Family of unknown function (DUF6058)